MGIVNPETGTRDPKGIEYLALEGGGGKGLAFVGTVQYLEEVDVLPLHRAGRPNQILGISGASAGAITALLIALGLSSKKINEQIADPSILQGFMDEAQLGLMRQVSDEYTLGRGMTISEDNDPYASDLPAETVDLAALARAVVGVELVGKLPLLPSDAEILFRAVLEYAKYSADYAMISNALLRDPHAYMMSLVHEFGFFPGLKVRAFFHEILRAFLPGAIERLNGPGSAESALRVMKFEFITFAQFKTVTGLDLAFTGTNITTRKPVLFSGADTPDFPVAEAVAISMNLPFVYKPIAVTALVNGMPEHQGLYCDGGLLNNLPIHAFDAVGSSGAAPVLVGPEPTLHPGVLGLRLTAGFNVVPPTPFYPVLAPKSGLFGGRNLDSLNIAVSQFGGFLGALWETLNFPSEEGMLHSPQERSQTIELFAGNLSTLNFLPPAADIDAAVRAAYTKTKQYFA